MGDRIISLVRNNNGAFTPHGCMATVVDANGAEEVGHAHVHVAFFEKYFT